MIYLMNFLEAKLHLLYAIISRNGNQYTNRHTQHTSLDESHIFLRKCFPPNDLHE